MPPLVRLGRIDDAVDLGVNLLGLLCASLVRLRDLLQFLLFLESVELS